MSITAEELRATIVPKSDRLNADQLVVGPMDITVTEIKYGTDEKQNPIFVLHYANEAGRPFKPCKTMRRVLVAVWGDDAQSWIGRSMRVYADPRVMFGGEEVGGVRISHMTDIPGKRVELKLPATRGKRVMHTIERMEPAQSGPTLAHVLQLIAVAVNGDDMKAAKEAAKTLKDGADVGVALDAYKARVNALKAAAKAPAPPTSEPGFGDVEDEPA